MLTTHTASAYACLCTKFMYHGEKYQSKYEYNERRVQQRDGNLADFLEFGLIYVVDLVREARF